MRHSVFSKNTQTSSSSNLRPLGAELFRADRQTDMTKLTVAFLSVPNSSKMMQFGGQLTVAVWRRSSSVHSSAVTVSRKTGSDG